MPAGPRPSPDANSCSDVASPFPPAAPKHEDELIVPARDGALRVLRASRDHRVKRVVLTSSFAAIGYGHPERSTPFTEADWTDPGKEQSAYVKSKTIAERAAWDFIAKEGGGLELAVINPVFVMGPVLGRDFSTSIALVKRMLEGAMPGCPKLYFGAVDVRDVADHHIRAMTNPAARGERFLSVSGNFMRLIQVATALRNGLGDAAKKAPTRELPNWHGAAGVLTGFRGQAVRARTGQGAKRDERKITPSARLVAAIARGRNRGNGREPVAAGTGDELTHGR